MLIHALEHLCSERVKRPSVWVNLLVGNDAMLFQVGRISLYHLSPGVPDLSGGIGRNCYKLLLFPSGVRPDD
jgi:hypothetical protein